jgi:hypothetical protein
VEALRKLSGTFEKVDGFKGEKVGGFTSEKGRGLVGCRAGAGGGSKEAREGAGPRGGRGDEVAGVEETGMSVVGAAEVALVEGFDGRVGSGAGDAEARVVRERWSRRDSAR